MVDKEKKIALFLTLGGSLNQWKNLGILERELAIYKVLYLKYKIKTIVISFGNKKEKDISNRYNFLDVICNELGLHQRLYQFLLPIIGLHKFKNVKLVKTNQFYGVHLARRVATLFKKPLIIRQGYNFLSNRKKEKISKKLLIKATKYEKKFIDKGDQNIFTTDKIAKEYSKVYNLCNKKINIVPNYFIKEFWSPKYKISTNKKTLIFIGRLEKYKNIITLIKVIQKMKLKLIIIGNGSLKKKIKKILDENKINHQFYSNIEQKELKKYLNKCDAFVLPSLYEGHPKILIEMMAYKIPVITTNVDGIKNLLRDKKSSIMSYGTDFNAIHKAINDFYKLKTSEKKQIVNRAYKIVKNFSLNKVVEMEYLIYKKLFAK